MASFFKTLIMRYVYGVRGLVIRNPFDRTYCPLAPKYCDKNFIRSLPKTRECFSRKQLSKAVKEESFDAFIVGSDQVWREEYTPDITAYFLDFLTVNDTRPKIAYSASFGISEKPVSREQLPYCVELLKMFSAISVREDSGLDIIREEFGINKAIKTLDPTLLLTEKDYRMLIKPDDDRKILKISAYILDYDYDKREVVRLVGDFTGTEANIFDCNYHGKPMMTVSQWLAAFANADFIVTDSFHGMVFSIIFKKDFIIYANKERGIDRFISLLGKLGLQNRIVFSSEEFKNNKYLLLSNIDYEKVYAELGILKGNSMAFLKEALDN